MTFRWCDVLASSYAGQFLCRKVPVFIAGGQTEFSDSYRLPLMSWQFRRVGSTFRGRNRIVTPVQRCFRDGRRARYFKGRSHTMTRSLKLSGLAAAVLTATVLTLPEPAAAQSFNCRAASNAAERAVCGSDRLSDLDDRMSELYNQLLSGTAGERTRGWVRDYQRRFLSARDACGRNTGCIKGAYLDQISVLSARVRVAEESSD
jgi:uncharacterized protein YecT (DUF1311 family)